MQYLWHKIALFIALSTWLGLIPSASQAATLPQPECKKIGKNAIVSPADFGAWNGSESRDIPQLALVIGNNYDEPGDPSEVRSLPNPSRDAERMSQLLYDKGYNVVCLVNLSADSLFASVIAFSNKWNSIISPHGVIYFAGHGGETAAGEAFILPADYDALRQSSTYVAQAPTDPLRKVSVDRLFSFLPLAPGAAEPIVIIDTCRSHSDAPTEITDSTSKAFPWHPIEKAATVLQSDRSPAYQRIFTTSNGEVADDGPPQGFGPFADELYRHLDHVSWKEIRLDPELSPLIAGLIKIFAADHIKQTPTPPASIRSESDYLWIPSDDNLEDESYWWLGVSHSSYEQSKMCQLPRMTVSKLESLPKEGNPWVDEALTVYRKMFPSCFPTQELAANEELGNLESISQNAKHIEASANDTIDFPRIVAGSHMDAAAALPRLLGGNRQSTVTSAGITNSEIEQRAAPDTSVINAIKDHSDGLPLTTKVAGSTTSLYSSLSALVGRELSAEDFYAQHFEVSCKGTACTDRRVHVQSQDKLTQGYLQTDAIVGLSIPAFAVPIKMPFGLIATSDVQSLNEFLADHNSPSAQVYIRIKLMAPERAIQIANIPRILFAAQQIESISKFALGTDDAHVSIDESLRTDFSSSAPCLSRGEKGPCIVVEIESMGDTVANH